MAAWRQLPGLREPDKLKPWLCGIARHLVHGSLRQNRRVPTAGAEPLDEQAQMGSGSPRDRAIEREEEAILWTALEALPLLYREPMVLFYREQESVAVVASALDLSEDAVKQRLARGRAKLTEQIDRTVHATLRRSTPSRAFTLAVLAALPFGLNSAKAATVGAMALKGGAAAKGALGLGVLGALVAPLAAVLGTYFERKALRDGNDNAGERIFNEKLHLLTGLTGGAIVLVVIIAKLWIQPIFHLQPSQVEAGMIAAAAVLLLGLGLLFVRLAISGGVSMGGLAVGALSFGGVAVGLLGFGGAALGWGAVGGLAIGWMAAGGGAIAWKAALGGGAVAHEFALGGGVAAAHANDAMAKAFAQKDTFFRLSQFVLGHATWVNWMYLPMAVFYGWRLRKMRSTSKSTSSR